MRYVVSVLIISVKSLSSSEGTGRQFFCDLGIKRQEQAAFYWVHSSMNLLWKLVGLA